MAWEKPTPDQTRENWAAIRRIGRRYAVAATLPFLALIWVAGYGKGLLDAPCRNETISAPTGDKETTK